MINTKTSTIDLIKEYQSGNKGVLEVIINQNQNLAYSLVNRYKVSRKEEKEDLNQIAIVGLIKAIDNFNLNFSVNFSTYAVPIILGEIKKHFRESSLLKISRNIKDLYYKIEAEKKEYYSLHNKEISIEELELKLNVNRYDIVLAMESNTHPISIDKEYDYGDSNYTLQDTIPVQKNDFTLDLLTLSESINCLNEKEKLLVKLRYYNDLSQKEVASKFNVSQVQISRLEKQILDKLRKYF